MIQKDKNIQEVESIEVDHEVETHSTEIDYDDYKLETIEQIASTPLEKHSISDLKFPIEQDSSELKSSTRQIDNAERSLNNASNTAMKMGLKGVVTLSKIQQQLEDVVSTRAARLNTINTQSQQQSENYINLLSIFNFFGLSKMKKAFHQRFSKYGKSFSNSKLKKLIEKLVRRVKQPQNDS